MLGLFCYCCFILGRVLFSVTVISFCFTFNFVFSFFGFSPFCVVMIDLVLKILEMVGNRCRSNCEFVGLKASYKALLLRKKGILLGFNLSLCHACLWTGMAGMWILSAERFRQVEAHFCCLYCSTCSSEWLYIAVMLNHKCKKKNQKVGLIRELCGVLWI